MRALPQPRRSRARALKRLLHKVYRILSFQFIFSKRKSLLVKRRRTPFHLSSRKYKVKLPKRYGPRTWFKRSHPKSRIPDISVDEGNDLQNHFPGANVQFHATRKRDQLPISKMEGRHLRRLTRRVLYRLYTPRRHKGVKNINIIFDA